MGMFDSFHFKKGDEDIEAQLKAGRRLCFNYEEGDNVYNEGYEDGIYKDHDNLIVIKDGVFVAGFTVDHLKSKRGFPIKEVIEDLPCNRKP